jgi:hypothetical protein
MGVAQPEFDEGAEEAAEASDELDMDLPQNAAASRGMTGHRPGGGATAQGRRCGWGGIRMRSTRARAAALMASALRRWTCCVPPPPRLKPPFPLQNVGAAMRRRAPCTRSQSESFITVGQPVRSNRLEADRLS